MASEDPMAFAADSPSLDMLQMSSSSMGKSQIEIMHTEHPARHCTAWGSMGERCQLSWAC